MRENTFGQKYVFLDDKNEGRYKKNGPDDISSCSVGRRIITSTWCVDPRNRQPIRRPYR